MDVYNDIICSLIETPFSRRNEQERREILSMNRSTPNINILSSDKKQGQVFSRSFKVSWYENHNWLCGVYLKKLYFAGRKTKCLGL
jgi:hypothetical protein